MQHSTMKTHLQHAIINVLGKQVSIGASHNSREHCQSFQELHLLQSKHTMLICLMDLDIFSAFDIQLTNKNG